MMNEYLENFKKCDIFTPSTISKQMAQKLHKNGTLLEPSVGIGNLLDHIKIDDYEKIDIFDIKKEYIDNCPNHPKINKYLADFLKHETTDKYDNIILNPPYIKIQDLHYDYVSFIKEKWSIFKNGNIDIYYAFLFKCLELLNENGVMVAITPNSYLHNKSALKFRKYLLENKWIEEIIDFQDKHVFDNAAVYCCITIFTKKEKDVLIYNNNRIDYNNINQPNNTMHLIHCNCNTSQKTLKEICKIYNGIATLRDAVYIHDIKLYDEPCWKKIKTSTSHKYCIYPYDSNGIIIDENTFKTNNPNTYEYLLSKKKILAERDNGNKTYVTWYAYGRSQSIKVSKKEKVIYIPSLINPNDLKYTIEEPKLHVGCLCIEPINTNDIPKIIECIKNNTDYLFKNSSKKNNGWINLSTTLLYGLFLDNFI
jgi:hypothetical protein